MNLVKLVEKYKAEDKKIEGAIYEYKPGEIIPLKELCKKTSLSGERLVAYQSRHYYDLDIGDKDNFKRHDPNAGKKCSGYTESIC